MPGITKGDKRSRNVIRGLFLFLWEYVLWVHKTNFRSGAEDEKRGTGTLAAFLTSYTI